MPGHLTWLLTGIQAAGTGSEGIDVAWYTGTPDPAGFVAEAYGEIGS